MAIKNRIDPFRRIAILLVFGWSAGWAQNDSDHPISELVGGHIQAELTVSGSMALWGFSGRSAENPAGLGIPEKGKFVFEWSPGISWNINKWIGAEDRSQKKIDGLIRDYGTAESRVQYPSLSPRMGFQSDLTRFEAAFPLHLFGRRIGIGLGYSVPLSLNLQLTGTGIEAGLDSEQKIQGELKRVRMRIRSGLDGLFQLRMNHLEFGAGVEVGEGTAVGVALIRSHLQIKAEARAMMDGIVEISGTEYVYNDPFDPRIDFHAGERNDINQSFDARYSGSGWGFRIGAVKKLSRSLRIEMTLGLPSRVRLRGADSLINNRIPFIKSESGESGGGFDDLIDPAKIDLAKLTKTERIVKKNQYSPRLSIPGALDVNIRWEKGKTGIALRCAIYRGGFSIDSRGKKLGIELKQGLGLEADFACFFLGGSVDFAKELKSSGKPGQSLAIPKAHLGFRIPVHSSLSLEGLLGADPLPVFLISGEYRL
jgi:hypothetical protein